MKEKKEKETLNDVPFHSEMKIVSELASTQSRHHITDTSVL